MSWSIFRQTWRKLESQIIKIEYIIIIRLCKTDQNNFL